MKPVFPPPLQILSLEHVVLERPTEKSNPVVLEKESKSFEHLDFLFPRRHCFSFPFLAQLF